MGSLPLKNWQAALLFSTGDLRSFLWRFLSPSGHWVLSKMGEDLTGQFVWWRQFGFEELKKGHLALWNPQLFCGEPFFGGFQSALLYPPNWLFMVLPLPFAINSSIALHVFLAGFFTYLWIKFRGSRSVSALLAALMFMFGASLILHIVPGHLPNLCTMAWIPLVFLSLDLCEQKKDFRWVGLGMFALSMQIFSGHIQYVYYTVVLLTIYFLTHLAQLKNSRMEFILKFVAMGLGAGALCAVQILSGWEAMTESARSQVLTIDFIDISDISPERLWCLLMPNFFDGWKSYWGGGIYWEGAVFVSVTAFMIALWVLGTGQRKDKKFFCFLALGLILIGIGKRAPFFVLFFKFFPLFDRFRGVGKLNIFITLCLAVLSAMGMDQLFENPNALRKFKSFVLKAAVWVGIISLIFYLAPRFGGQKLFKNYINHAGSMTESLLGCALLLVLIGWIAGISVKRPMARYGLLALAFIELFVFASANLPFFDADLLRGEIQPIQTVYQKDPGDYRVFTGTNNYPLGTSGFGAWGDDPFVPYRYSEFACQTHSLTNYYHNFFHPLENYPRSLSLTRLKYAFYEQSGNLIMQKLNLPQVPRAFLVDSWKTDSLESIWPHVLSPSFDPLKQVWLEQDPKIISGTQGENGNVVLKDLSSDCIEISARNVKPEILVITDNYSRGWKAIGYPDSAQKNYSVLPVNGFMRGIPLPAGIHHILLEYQPAAFVVGCWISWISWFIFIGFFFLSLPLTQPRKWL